MFLERAKPRQRARKENVITKRRSRPSRILQRAKKGLRSNQDTSFSSNGQVFTA